MNEKYLVAISGKIESIVAAWLLKKQGKQLRGIFFDLVGLESTRETVANLERKLNISIQLIDCKDEFAEILHQEITNSILDGKKMSAKEIFHQRILFAKIFKLKEQYQAQKISTGHRVQVREDGMSGLTKVYRYEDEKLDESSLLVGVKQAELKHLEFPLGAIPGSMIQKIADELKIVNESATLDLNWNDFFLTVREDVIKNKFSAQERIAEFISPEGMKLGSCADFTRLAPGETVETHTVLEIDGHRHRVTIGSLSTRFIHELQFENVSWFTRDDLGVEPLSCSMIWSKHPQSVPVKLIQYEGNRAKAYFEAPLQGKDSNIFHGETVLWISGQEVLGGAQVMRKIAVRE